MTTDEVAHASATAATPRSSFGTSATFFSQLMSWDWAGKLSDFYEGEKGLVIGHDACAVLMPWSIFHAIVKPAVVR